MATAVTTTTGHVARALRFYEVGEIFVGIAVTDPWTDEAVPPAVDASQKNIGRIYTPIYSGGSVTSLNTYAKFNNASFLGGSIGYKITALSASTYDVRRLSDNVLIGSASYAAQAAARTNIVQGLSITVTNTSMTIGHYHSFLVDGAISYQLIDQRQLVIPDVSGTIEYRGQNYLIVTPEEAIEKGARFVYLLVTFRYDDHPLTDFRQLGVFTGLTRAVGVAGGKENLLPAEVESVGALELLDNRTAITRDIGQREMFSLIIEH